MDFQYSPNKCSEFDTRVMRDLGVDCNPASKSCGGQALDLDEVIEIIYDMVSDECAMGIDDKNVMHFEACEEGGQRRAGCKVSHCIEQDYYHRYTILTAPLAAQPRHKNLWRLWPRPKRPMRRLEGGRRERSLQPSSGQFGV